MNILRHIVAYKKKLVAARMVEVSTTMLEQESAFQRECISLSQNLLAKNTGVIAEFKRKSPSKGWIKENAEVGEIAPAYEAAGSAAISVLTDFDYFGGSIKDLTNIRQHISVPILRKEFVVNEYQLIEGKAIGADAVLLIAACLKPEQTKQFSTTAKSLGLEVLLEVHNERELELHFNDNIDVLGVNNRDLTKFTTDIEISKRLFPLIPDNVVKISESGISQPQAVLELKKCGYQGFLVGEHFMRSNNPGEACKQLIKNTAT